MESDKAIKNFDEDCFQRGSFALRIASLIRMRKDTSSLSIGVYGKWGEGKTSVINLIKKKLKESEIEIMDFNPWLFSNEENLLVIFFAELVAVLDTLEDSKGAKIGQKLKEYSKIIGAPLSLLGGDFDKFISEVGGKLSDKSLLERKEEIENALVSEKKKIVVFLDDIDRLDKDELYSVFRLIKLTGDFNNITYILAFDDSIVSEMLSDRYAGNGGSYLEKIIQFPLKIPKADKYDLKKYCRAGVNEVLKDNNVELSDRQLQDLEGNLNRYIIPCLDNPRLVVRYVNSIGFSIPMLLGEVNILDLLMIEWIKVSMPDVYNLIRNNSDLFVKSFSSDHNVMSFGKTNYSVKEAREIIEPIFEDTYSVEEKLLKQLLTKLFPNLKSVLELGNNAFLDSKVLRHQQRICVADYFDRYFSYSIRKDQISDVEYNNFINCLATENIDTSVNEFIEKYDSKEISFRLALTSEVILSEYYIPFTKSIASIAYKFSSNSDDYSLLGNRSELPFSIANVIKKISKEERLNAAEEIIKSSKPIAFGWSIFHSLRPKKMDFEDQNPLTSEEYDELGVLIYKLTNKEYSFGKLINEFDVLYSSDHLLIWSKNDKSKLDAEIKKYLSRQGSILDIIKVFGVWNTNLNNRKYYFSSLSTQGMKDVCTLIDRDWLKEHLLEKYGEKKAPEKTRGEEMSNEELVGLIQMYIRRAEENKK